VQRQLAGLASSDLRPSTSLYGDTFEAFVIQEIYRMSSYSEAEYDLSFYSSKHGFEVDLILSRGKERLFIEIKSTEMVDEIEVRSLQDGLTELLDSSSRVIYLSRDSRAQRIGRVECKNYRAFIEELFCG
jgi:predicted AAA+ superfamily ATPase